MKLNKMKVALQIIGLVGAVIFGTAFWFTWGVPGYVEEAAKEFIKNKVEEETIEKIDLVAEEANENKLVQLAEKLLRDQEVEIDKLKDQLKNNVHEKLASVIAEMRDLSCECRILHAQRIKADIEFKINNLESANKKIIEFMKTKYMEVSNNLTKDLRIFTGSNLVIFIFLLLVSFLKPKAIAHLFLPGILLIISTLVCSYFYIFEQNWFFTLIYNDFIGFGYTAYIGILFLILCDIVFNKARITTEIINAILSAISNVIQVVPLSPC